MTIKILLTRIHWDGTVRLSGSQGHQTHPDVKDLINVPMCI